MSNIGGVKIALNSSSIINIVIGLHGLKFADATGNEQDANTANFSQHDTEIQCSSNEILAPSHDISMLTTNGCLTCKCEFLEREDQVAHYRSDWHRYNIKLRLLGQANVSEEAFEEIADSLSISGSESDDSTAEPEEAINLSTSVLKHDEDDSVKFHDDRRPKFYFKNETDEIVSIYKKVLCNKQGDVTGLTITSLLNQLLTDVQNCYWLVILFNAGHFAAAVFDGAATALTHKTFHRYIVRAKRGTVQSLNDSSNRGHTAKSAGATLRRHNEAALEESIKTLIKSWKEEYVDKCSHIFIRIPHYRKSLFYGGKEPLFDHNDQRLRSIPFVTRRPTFNEVKRVHKELFSLTLHGNANISDLLSQPKTKTNKNVIEETIDEQNKDGRPNPHSRQLDNAVSSTQVATNYFEENNTNEIPNATSKSKKKKKTKDRSKVIATSKQREPKEIAIEKSDESSDQLSIAEQRLLEKLYTACKTSDIELLTLNLNVFCDTKFAKNNPLNSENNEPSTDDNQIPLEFEREKTNLLCFPLDKSGETLLHVASRAGDKTIILKLLETGADPAMKNKSFQPPYCVCSNKEAKNTYRRFRAKYPDMYDYNKAQVASPLSEEVEAEVKRKQAEKKRAQKAAKREREKAAKEEEKKLQEENEKKLEEQTERQRFLALSDREKRLIAVERRLADQPHAQLTQTRRCYTCAESLFAKVPFEYLDFQFCSINCLKLHKAKNKT